MTIVKRVGSVLLCAALVSAWVGTTVASVTVPIAPAPTRATVTATMFGMPIQFEANHGQVDEAVKFLARGKGYTLFLTPTESVMVLSQSEANVPIDDRGAEFLMSLTFAPSQPNANTQVGDRTAVGRLLNTESKSIKQSVVRMKLEGANPSSTVSGMEQLPGIVNYFIGNDPAKWRTKIPTYAKVQYQDVYPGIDLAYYGNQGKLEYDFIVAPGADPGEIKLAFEGASDIKVADSGDLLLTTPVGDVRLQKPMVYQLEPDGRKTLVAGTYVVAAPSDRSSMVFRSSPTRAVGIQLAAYDHSKPVVIDPVVVYSTYLGGSGGQDLGRGIAVDSAGAAYVTGDAISVNFPVLSASQGTFAGLMDAFVTKLDASGTRVYSTYLGGSGSDAGYGIAVDGAGAAYVTGRTASSNFPVLSASQGVLAGAGTFDAFVTKLDAAGARLYSTYLGGSDIDEGYGIAVDGAGAAYVTGETRSPNFPLLSASQGVFGGGVVDAFVTKFNAAGARVYSTFLGGGSSDIGHGIAVDGAGSAYVTGWTASSNFPLLSASQGVLAGAGTSDAFVTKLDAAGVRVYSTYLGGSNNDEGRGIAVDGAGAAYITGRTASTNFPVLAASQVAFGGGLFDAFVTKLDAAGARLYSTYLGGSHIDEGYGIAVNGAGSAYVTGRTFSTNFPVLAASQEVFGGVGGFSDAFVSKLDTTGARLYSTYLGGSHIDEGYGIAVDGAGGAYVTGQTASTNFPVLSASQGVYAGSGDAFITKLVDKPMADAGLDQSVPMGTVVTLNGTGSTGGLLTYSWTQVPGVPSVALTGANTANPTFTAPAAPLSGGNVTFKLVVCEGASGNCSDPDSINVHITNVNRPPVADAGPDQTVQEGSTVVLDGTASYDPDVEPVTYTWILIPGPLSVTLTDPNTATPSFTAPLVGAGGGRVDFELIVADARGLIHSDYIFVNISNVNQPPVTNAGPDQTRNENTVVTLDGSASSDPDLDTLHFSWSQTGGPGVALTGATTPSPTFTTPAVGPGGALLTFQLVVNDGQASGGGDTVQIVVQDINDPPVCTSAQPSVSVLWPPNHTMTQMSIIGLTDPHNQTLTITYTTVRQDEPINGLGDGDTSPDAAISGNDILLRAERSGTGNGRVYVLQFTATNSDGAQCNGTVKVSVPRDKKDAAVEGPQLYNSFGP